MGGRRRPSVILLHGIGDNAHIWDPCAVDLSGQGLRVIALDQRGHGLSDWADPPGYGCADYVADLKKFIGELRLAGFVLMGHSMGALHATLYAALEPQRVAGLVHADIEPCPPAWNKKYLLNLYNELPLFYESIDDYVETIRKNYLHADLKMLYEIALHEAVRGEDGKLRPRFDREVLSHFDPSYDLVPHLGRIICPALVIRGRESRVMTEEAARQMSRSIPKGEFAQIEKAAHPLHIDNPAGFQQEYQGFSGELDFCGSQSNNSHRSTLKAYSSGRHFYSASYMPSGIEKNARHDDRAFCLEGLKLKFTFLQFKKKVRIRRNRPHIFGDHQFQGVDIDTQRLHRGDHFVAVARSLPRAVRLAFGLLYCGLELSKALIGGRDHGAELLEHVFLDG